MDELNDDEEEVPTLGDAARSLIARAETEDEPPAGAEDESWGMVVSRVDESRGQPAAAAAPPAPTSARWVGAVVLALALATVVGLGVWVVQSGPPPTPATERPAAPATKSDAPPRSDPAPTRSEGKAPSAPATGDPGTIAPVLDDVEAALDAGQAARALELLEQHAKAAPLAPDMQRRLALRVRTLCALERIDDARNEGAAFLARHASSPFAADVRASCAGPR